VNRCRLGGLACAVMAAAAFPAGAAAEASAPMPFSYTYSAVMTAYCPFDVNVVTDASGFRTDVVDPSGTVTRSYIHQNARDTFTANGRTLTSFTFESNIQVTYDSSGNPNLTASGVMEVIPLPDGSRFLTAGRAFFTANAALGHQLSPDRGNPGDVAAFCAALSP